MSFTYEYGWRRGVTDSHKSSTRDRLRKLEPCMLQEELAGPRSTFAPRLLNVREKATGDVLWWSSDLPPEMQDCPKNEPAHKRQKVQADNGVGGAGAVFAGNPQLDAMLAGMGHILQHNAQQLQQQVENMQHVVDQGYLHHQATRFQLDQVQKILQAQLKEGAQSRTRDVERDKLVAGAGQLGVILQEALNGKEEYLRAAQEGVHLMACFAWDLLGEAELMMAGALSVDKGDMTYTLDMGIAAPLVAQRLSTLQERVPGPHEETHASDPPCARCQNEMGLLRACAYKKAEPDFRLVCPNCTRADPMDLEQAGWSFSPEGQLGQPPQLTTDIYRRNVRSLMKGLFAYLPAVAAESSAAGRGGGGLLTASCRFSGQGALQALMKKHMLEGLEGLELCSNHVEALVGMEWDDASNDAFFDVASRSGKKWGNRKGKVTAARQAVVKAAFRGGKGAPYVQFTYEAIHKGVEKHKGEGGVLGEACRYMYTMYHKLYELCPQREECYTPGGAHEEAQRKGMLVLIGVDDTGTGPHYDGSPGSNGMVCVGPQAAWRSAWWLLWPLESFEDVSAAFKRLLPDKFPHGLLPAPDATTGTIHQIITLEEMQLVNNSCGVTVLLEQGHCEVVTVPVGWGHAVSNKGPCLKMAHDTTMDAKDLLCATVLRDTLLSPKLAALMQVDYVGSVNQVERGLDALMTVGKV